MSWEEHRTGGLGTVRRTAHADDAKDRVDETEHLTRPRTKPSRGRLPLVLAGLLVLVLVGGAATAAVLLTGDDGAAPAARNDAASDDDPSDPAAAGAAVDPGTGLPTEPTTEEVTYRATATCRDVGAFTVQCGDRVDILTCPGGTCTIGVRFGPEFAPSQVASMGSEGALLSFQAGQPAVKATGKTPAGAPQCPDEPVTLTGGRAGDGSYSLVLRQTQWAGNGDGSCSRSAELYDITLSKLGS